MVLSASVCARVLLGQIFLNIYCHAEQAVHWDASLNHSSSKTGGKNKNPSFLFQDKKVSWVSMKE